MGALDVLIVLQLAIYSGQVSNVLVARNKVICFRAALVALLTIQCYKGQENGEDAAFVSRNSSALQLGTAAAYVGT
jgi:hypothetical protein